MNIFIIVFGILMCLAEIISVSSQLSSILKDEKLTNEDEKILYIKNNRNIFGVFDKTIQENDKNTIVLSPAEIGI